MPLPDNPTFRDAPDPYAPAMVAPYFSGEIRSAVDHASWRGIGRSVYDAIPSWAAATRELPSNPLREREPFAGRPFSWNPVWRQVRWGASPRTEAARATGRGGPGQRVGSKRLPGGGLAVSGAGLAGLGQAATADVEAATRRAITMSAVILALGGAGIVAAYAIRRRLER